MKKSYVFILIGVLGFSFYYLSNRNEERNLRNSLIDDVIVSDSVKSTSLAQVDYLFPELGNHQIIEHKLFSLSYNEEHEQADWVAYKLFPNSINNRVKRKDNFRSDTFVLTGSASVSDYKKSGYDRGHLAPAKAMSFSKETMSESFYMSNMSPQLPSFNRGIWKKLEERVRSWIPLSDSLYIVTGPVLSDSLGVIGRNMVTIPKAYFKSIIRFKNNEIQGIGFMLKNEKSSKELNTFVVSIDSIEKVTKLDFFNNLDFIIENRIEKNSSLTIFIKE
jgi:endonuclease G